MARAGRVGPLGGQSVLRMWAPCGLRSLLDKAIGFALATTDDGRRLPPPSPDYWEVPVSRTSLGTVALLLTGLQASQRLYGALGEPALASVPEPRPRDCSANVRERFDDGYERFATGGRAGTAAGGRGHLPACPRSRRSAAPGAVDAWIRYQSDALRSAGGLAPGAQWKQDGISWTPETALVAYTASMSGRREVAEHWMDWLSAHRTAGAACPRRCSPAARPPDRHLLPGRRPWSC